MYRYLTWGSSLSGATTVGFLWAINWFLVVRCDSLLAWTGIFSNMELGDCLLAEFSAYFIFLVLA